MPRHAWLSVLLVLGAAEAAQGQVQLRWRFKEGDTFFVEEAVAVKQTTKVMGNEEQHNLDVTRVSRFTVLKAGEGQTVLEQKVETVKVTPGDGAKKGEADFLQKLEGAVFRITLGPTQHVAKFEGYQELINKLAQDKEVARMLRVLLTEDTLRRTAEALLEFVPDKPVSPGGTWKAKLTMPFGPLGSLDTVNTYTLQGKEKADGREAEKITVAAVVAYAPPRVPSGLAFQITKGDIKAEEARGTIFFDEGAGRLVRSESRRRLKGTLTLSAMERTLDMDIDQEQTVKIRVLEKNPTSK
jgi:hypothetical protein